MLTRMTTRMTWAIAVASFGLGVAALGGLPFFIENRVAGDVLVVLGLATTFSGVVLAGFAIPGQRRAIAISKNRVAHELDALKAERQALTLKRNDARKRLRDHVVYSTMQAGLKVIGPGPASKITSDLERNVARLDDALLENELKFRRLGHNPE